ncbi:hypothetical protein GF319_05155 [Candidatus Bathyarchaeota archaeon]|nr:hypothetical protein [Candidatus Bathyarchaeota archaeon]
MAVGTECKLRDCSHNQNNTCQIDSSCEPLLDWMSFSGYCPDYDGEKFPGVRDESRQGKSRFK